MKKKNKAKKRNNIEPKMKCFEEACPGACMETGKIICKECLEWAESLKSAHYRRILD